MKQIYYTSCEAGKSVSGKSGFQVRAASSGIAPHLLQLAGRFASYELPADVPGETQPKEAPARLALLETPEMGRFICHSVHVGRDPATQRFGNFFSHLLLDPPADLDLALLLRSWQGPFWTWSDNGGGTTLAERSPTDLSDGRILTDAALTAFLRKPGRRELFSFLVRALIGGRPGTRIFLAASDRDAALCLYGVARFLPRSVLRGLTFSTYERSPLLSPARIVATFWKEGSTQDLPASCYEGSALGFNSFTGRQSPLPTASPFAERVVEAACAGRFNETDAFRATWDRLNLDEIDLLDLVHRLSQQNPEPSPADVQQALARPALGPLLTSRIGLTPRIVEWSLRDSAFREKDFPRYVAILKPQPVALKELADSIEEQGTRRLLEDHDIDKARVLLEMLPIVVQGRDRLLWDRLFQEVQTPACLPRSVHRYLLPRVLAEGERGGAKDRLLAWLDVDAEQLDDVLELPLSPAHRQLACIVALSRQPRPDGAATRSLAKRPEMLLDVLPRLKTSEQAVEIFRHALEGMNADRFPETLLARADALGDLLDPCLFLALTRCEVDAVWTKRHGPEVLRRLPNGESTAYLVRRLLLDPPSDLPGSALVEFLGAAGRSGAKNHLTRNESAQLESVLMLEDGLRRRFLDERELGMLARALEALPASIAGLYSPRLQDKLLECLRSDSRPRTSLELMLLWFGPILAGSPKLFYRRLVSDVKARSELMRNAGLVHALVAVGFGEVSSPKLAEVMDDLDDTATELVELLKRGNDGGKNADRLSQEASQWRNTQAKRMLKMALRTRGEDDDDVDGFRLLGMMWKDWLIIVLFAVVVVLLMLLMTG